MEAQDQQIGLRVFWTVGFLGLGTLSAIGAAALFPWYLAVVIAILVVGMASACAIQLRVTRNILYLVAMLAMTCLASFLDGVSVWEILNNRQNTLLRGIQSVQSTTDEQLKLAEKRVQDLRDEIATLNEQAQNMDNDGNSANDKQIPGLMAKIESKKADLPNLEAKADALRGKVVEAASKAGVTDAERHFFLKIADEHKNPALWLISCASLAFLVPELTLALLAWSFKGGRREQMRPQPVVIVSQPGAEHHQAQVWQTMHTLAAPAALPHSAVAYPQPPLGIREATPQYAPPAAHVYAAPAPVYSQPAPVPAEAPVRMPERPVAMAVEASPAAIDSRMGLGQWMMASAPTQEAAPAMTTPVQETVSSEPAKLAQAPSAFTTNQDERATETQPAEEEVMLAPDSVPQNEFIGNVSSERNRPVEAALRQPEVAAASRDGRAEQPQAESNLDLNQPAQPPSVLEAARNRDQHSGKTSPTKLAKNAAAKRLKKGGMRSRGTLADLASASRLN